MSLEQARSRIWMLDSKGLVARDRLETLAEHKRDFARDQASLTGLTEVISRARPTVLIGVSGAPGAFDREVLHAMCRYCERPIVFALSNPTTKLPAPADSSCPVSATICTSSPVWAWAR